MTMDGKATADPLTPTLSPVAGGEGVRRAMIFGKVAAAPLTPTLSPVAGGEGAKGGARSRGVWALTTLDVCTANAIAAPSPACGRGLG
jgi:hypothetical protein